MVAQFTTIGHSNRSLAEFVTMLQNAGAVSYTHLDVYKRQCLSGYFMDQFTHAERATDWRGNNNIAESIFQQLASERYPIPSWIVMSAGTGGTTATIGRYIRYKRHATRLSVADVERSAFFEGFSTRNLACRCDRPSRIEGIGLSLIHI